jgi:type IV pilus assembly protein PilZ
MGMMLKTSDASTSPLSLTESDAERRVHDRFDVTWAVDCVADDTFLYASLANISEMGIFVKTTDPLAVGTSLWLSFKAPQGAGKPPPDGGKALNATGDADGAFKLEGVVAWVNPLRPNGDNPNPGMGVRFIGLTPENRERLVEVVRAVAYLRE